MPQKLALGIGLLLLGVVIFAVGRASHEPHGFVQLDGLGIAYLGLVLQADSLRQSEKRARRNAGNALAVLVLLPVAVVIFLGLRGLTYFAAEMLR
jgi:hypothetical protein